MRDSRMVSFKEQWNLDMALDVLKSKSIDSKTWADAAKWILLYGPSALQHIMQEASGLAISSCYPQLEAERYTESGEPCYAIEKIAEILGMSKRETLQKMAELESEHDIRNLYESSETENIQ
jgi:hypothetical protein